MFDPGDFHFIRPGWLLVLLPLAFSLLVLGQNRPTETAWRRYIAPHLLQAMMIAGRQRRWFSPLTAATCIMVLLTIVMAGPTVERVASPLERKKSGLVLVLDVSRSMNQQDLQPTRLTRAKQKIHDLLDLQKDLLCGLIVYSGSAHVVIPLTTDYSLMGNLLQAVSTEIMPLRGKSAHQALSLIETLLDPTGVPGSVLLMADGVSDESVNRFAQYFSASEHSLLVYGIGGTGDAKDAAVWMPMQTGELQRLALRTGGLYQPVTHNKRDIIELNRHIANAMRRADDEALPWHDLGYYLVYPLLLLFLLFFRRGWAVQLAIVLMLVSAPEQPLYADERPLLNIWLTQNQQGRLHYEKEDYAEAAEHFEDVTWKGVAYYMAGNFDAAAEMFTRLETAQGFFSAGNAFAQARRYVAAEDAYTRCLSIDPLHAGAGANRGLVRSIIDEINAVSASQADEKEVDVGEPGDEPVTADGADRAEFGDLDVARYTAEEILSDPAINEHWMRLVQQSPARFLARKFANQLELRRLQ